MSRQMKLEGGFQGRTNKLVDACYSFWQGGACAIVDIVKREQTGAIWASPADQQSVVSLDDGVEVGPSIVRPTGLSGQQCYDQRALQRYLLHCSQQVEGGMRDKPGKSRDFYHTCYALSGLAVAQHPLTDGPIDSMEPFQVYGAVENMLQPTSAVYNIGRGKLSRAMAFFRSDPSAPRTDDELVQAYMFA